jgi:hypothetical protein
MATPTVVRDVRRIKRMPPRTGENPGFDFIQGIGARPAPGSSSASSTACPFLRVSVKAGVGKMTHVPIRQPNGAPRTMPIASGYSMDLYCRNNWLAPRTALVEERNKAWHEDERRHGRTKSRQFTGETWGQCKRIAQKSGWVFNRDGEVTCPMCARAALSKATPTP